MARDIKSLEVKTIFRVQKLRKGLHVSLVVDWLCAMLRGKIINQHKFILISNLQVPREIKSLKVQTIFRVQKLREGLWLIMFLALENMELRWIYKVSYSYNP